MYRVLLYIDHLYFTTLSDSDNSDNDTTVNVHAFEKDDFISTTGDLVVVTVGMGKTHPDKITLQCFSRVSI